MRENMPPRFGVKGERRCKKKITNINDDTEPEYIRQHSSYQKMTEISCSICAERRPAVQLCLACNEQDDKRVCEACAVRMHNVVQILHARVSDLSAPFAAIVKRRRETGRRHL